MIEAPQPVRFLQPIEVKALLLDSQRRDKILVLDVRDEDFAGGHIKCQNHVNIPSSDLSCVKAMDEFIRLYLTDNIDTAIIHCFLSQQRGPTTARRLANRLSQLERDGRPEVCVMAHGWRRWRMMFGDDPELCTYPDDSY